MSTSMPSSPIVFRHELEALRARWPWLLALGIGLVLLSFVALADVVMATLAAVITYGMILIAAGVLHLLGAFWARDWSGFFLALAAGIVALVVGVLSVRYPVAASEALTMLLAAFFVVGGLFRIAAAIMMRLPSWGWLLASGVLDVAMGTLIAVALPLSGFWVIGLFLAIELMLGGIWWITLALAIRRRTLKPS
jgi:uncharacterized membrane protein HdeD (DUF308 family)